MTNSYWLAVKDLDVDDLAEHGSVTPNSIQARAVDVAFQRLQTKALREGADAQIAAARDQRAASEALIRAAKATEATAKSTKDSALWLMWSVIVLAITNLANVIATIWDHYAALSSPIGH
jgi:hypothetical protein